MRAHGGHVCTDHPFGPSGHLSLRAKSRCFASVALRHPPEGPLAAVRLTLTRLRTQPLQGRQICSSPFCKRKFFAENPAGKLLKTALQNGGKPSGGFKKFSTFPVESTHSFPHISNRGKQAVWNPQIFHAFSKAARSGKTLVQSGFAGVFNFSAAPTATTMFISLVTCNF